MTKDEFNTTWNAMYPESIPISYFFRHDFSNRWFRIHSLPQSKRYAEKDEEWDILLSRQNQLINDLFIDNTKVLLVTGGYNWGEQTTFITDEEEAFKPYKFVRLDNISLFEKNPNEYDKEEIYIPAFAETIWTLNGHNNLLKAIATDTVRAFFLSFDKNIIIAPYDGGIDIVLKDHHTRDNFKEKYKQWLSEREDGL